MFFEKDTPFRVPRRAVRRWIKDTVKQEGRQQRNINIITTGDPELTQINIEYLDRSYRTDVISFLYEEEKGIEGEVYISIDTVIENARKFKTTPELEWLRVVIHGVLHLLGYEDQNPDQKERMRSREDHYLERFPGK